MNHCVPDFEIQMDEDEYPIIPPISSTSGFSRPKKPSMAKDEIMELLWENGQVVMHSQNHRHLRKTPPTRNTNGVIPIPTATGPSSATEIPPSQQARVENYHNHNHNHNDNHNHNHNQDDLFMQEDEMTSWLHYSIHEEPPSLDHNFSADLVYPPPAVNSNQSHNSTMHAPLPKSHAPELRQHQPSRLVVPRPPIPPTTGRPEQVLTKKIQNFANFSNHNARAEPSKTAARESTVKDSCDTPVVKTTAVAASRVSKTEPTERDNGRGSTSTAGVAAPWRTTSAGGGTATTTFEMTVTSSPGGSSGSAEPAQRAAAEDRKRKGREPEQSECQSEDVNFESEEAKKQVRGTKSTKRSRAAEVHNLSERRRRDRINEKMKALQELIPRCNKSDKASMLDEAIEYLKSLQLQVQMMSMGYGMVPMMFPGIQQYMPPMGMGIGMGMSMDMGMNRPVMPFPNMLAGSALPAATATGYLGPRFPLPPFHMPQVPAPDSSRMQAANQSDNMLTSHGAPDSDQSRIPNFSDPYHQYLGPHQMQLQLMQTMNHPNVSKPSTSRGHENPENHQSEET